MVTAAIKLPEDFDIQQKQVKDLKVMENAVVMDSTLIVKPDRTCWLISTHQVWSSESSPSGIKITRKSDGFIVTIPVIHKTKFSVCSKQFMIELEHNLKIMDAKLLPVIKFIKESKTENGSGRNPNRN